MVIYFKSEKALNFLLKHGFVYTLRSKRRVKLGRDWIKTSGSGKKIANVFIEEVGFFDLEKEKDRLLRFAPYSGFESIEEWLKEYEKLSGGAKKAWLYKVLLVRG